MSKHSKIRFGRFHQGFTILEVMVALVILGIGLLGLAALQTQGLRFNRDAYERSQAASLAYEMMDKIRANRTEAEAGSYAALDFDALLDDLDDGTETCDPLVLDAESDVLCWLSAIRATLPEGRGSILDPPVNENYFTVTVSWSEKDAGGDSGVVDENECLARGGSNADGTPTHQWVAPNLCLVSQSWVVFP